MQAPSPDAQMSQLVLDDLIVKMYFMERKIDSFYDVLESYEKLFSPTTSSVFKKILPYLFHHANVLHLKALVKHGFMGEDGKSLSQDTTSCTSN